MRQYFVNQSIELKTGIGKRVDWGVCFLAVEVRRCDIHFRKLEHGPLVHSHGGGRRNEISICL